MSDQHSSVYVDTWENLVDDLDNVGQNDAADRVRRLLGDASQ